MNPFSRSGITTPREQNQQLVCPASPSLGPAVTAVTAVPRSFDHSEVDLKFYLWDRCAANPMISVGIHWGVFSALRSTRRCLQFFHILRTFKFHNTGRLTGLIFCIYPDTVAARSTRSGYGEAYKRRGANLLETTILFVCSPQCTVLGTSLRLPAFGRQCELIQETAPKLLPLRK